MASRDLYPRNFTGCSRQKLRQSTIQHSHTGNLERFGRRIHRLRISCLFKSSQRHSARMGRFCHFTRRRGVPNRLDLHPAWRRRTGNQQHDNHVFRQIGRTDFLQNAAAQLGYRLHGQFGGHAGDGVFHRALCRHDRGQRSRKNHCRGGSKSPYGFRSRFRIGGRM